MSDLARLLQQYGYGEQPNPLAQDGVTYDTSNVLAGMPRPNALADALRSAASSIPENKEASLSMLNMVRGGLGTAANWLEGRPEIGKDTLAPLGAGLMGSAFAPQNALGIFGGRLAKTADHNALAKAEELAAKGADRKAIWDQTGWFQGADGKWRFEIPDNGVSFNADAVTAKMPSRFEIAEDIVGGMGLPKSKLYGDAEVQTYAFTEADKRLGAYRNKVEGNPLATALLHDELFAGYPDMKSVSVVRETLPTYSGTYKDNRITFGGGQRMMGQKEDPQAHLSTVLHEAQHAIQDRERFARGANKEMFDYDQDELRRKLFAYEDARFLKEEAAKRGISVEDLIPILEQNYGRKHGIVDFRPYIGADPAQLERAANRARRQLEDAANPQQAYRRTAGEVEARNVQTRMLMTPEERRARPPWETEDVPLHDQIVRWK